MNEYVFSVLPWGKEISVAATDEKAARRMAWNSLPDQAKDNTEGLDCVDYRSAPDHQIEGVTATQFGYMP